MADADVAKALELVKQLRLYPLKADASPSQRFVDMAGTLIDGVVAFDASFFESLARMVDEENVLTRDLMAMGMLRTLGIEKGKPFQPDAATQAILSEAAQEAHQGFMVRLRGGEPWWPGSQWKLSEDKGARTGFTFQDQSALFTDERALIYFMAFALPKKLGGATFYLAGANDSEGGALSGGETYTLRVLPNPPAKQYWAVTVYDLDTCCLIRGLSRPGLDSYNRDMLRNSDGSVDIHFSPKAPDGREANWVPTAPGKPWFSLFRFYGPDKPLFEKTWVLPDIDKVR
jgi:hypothetical protein